MRERSDTPLFTIITPCLNRGHCIAAAIDSALAQAEASFEHIIVDGGSTDGTLDVLARYPHLRVLSGRDRGVYDAINRGIGLARGQILAHLNSDDFFLPGALATVAAAFAREPDADAVCGGAVVLDALGGKEASLIHAYDDPAVKALRPFDLCRGVPIINARFFRRELYQRVGEYDISFRYAGDRDFLLRAHVAGMRTAIVPERVYAYVQHDASLTISAAKGRPVPWLDEHRRLAAHWIAAPEASPALRREAYAWHALEIGRAASLAALKGRVREALGLSIGALAVDPLWPARFLGQAVGRALDSRR